MLRSERMKLRREAKKLKKESDVIEMAETEALQKDVEREAPPDPIAISKACAISVQILHECRAIRVLLQRMNNREAIKCGEGECL